MKICFQKVILLPTRTLVVAFLARVVITRLSDCKDVLMSRISISMSSFVIGGPALPGIEVFPFTALCLLKSSFSIRSDPAKSSK